MKAIIFALIVLLGVDVAAYDARHVHAMGRGFAAAGHEFGEWMYQ